MLVPGHKPRDFQLRAAAAAHSGRDVFVIESAGSGKTLAAWLAGLLLGGVTLFISPLIALASEQAAKLNATKLELETELPPASMPTLKTAKQAM